MNDQNPRMKIRSVRRSGTRSAGASDTGAIGVVSCGCSGAAARGSTDGEKAARSTARDLLVLGEWAGRIVARNGASQNRCFEVHRWLAEVHPTAAELLLPAGRWRKNPSRWSEAPGLAARLCHTPV